MIQQFIKKSFNAIGYDIKKINKNVKTFDGYEIYQYHSSDGKFDYESYKQIQMKGNKQKM